MMVAGIGCRRGVDAAEVIAAVAAARAAHAAIALDTLATLKRDEPALAEAALRLGLPLLVVAPVDDARLLTRSDASRAATGAGSASEAAALAAAGAGARLLGPRLAVGRVTCAIATRDEP
ncbi:MAG: cobalamin biosynthesis protein [Amaricoccus sp.]|nr:cobalamin biosynthesis protein [Amaricoccus sp.]